MTRRQVAKRLGKSVTTVRKLEGVLLHPRQDARGVHWFDGEEVDALARDMQAGDVSAWREIRDAGDDEQDPSEFQIDERSRVEDLEREVRQLQEQLFDQARRHRQEVQTLELDHARALAEMKASVREFEREARQFLELTR